MSNEASTRYPMTVEGHEALKSELKQLKSVDRPRIVEEIATARAHGDLSENAEFHAAKERQGFIEARIADIETKLSRAQVIDVSTLGGERVKFGATVTVYDVESEDELRYKIVGEDEADLNAGKISITSPIARALIGKDQGDEVKIRTPRGLREVEVVSVEFV